MVSRAVKHRTKSVLKSQENAQIEISNTKRKYNEEVNSGRSTDIVQAIQQDRGVSCVRDVDVNKFIDKCNDLKRCIEQQRLPISNLKRVHITHNLKLKNISTSKDFDKKFTSMLEKLANTNTNVPKHSFLLTEISIC